MSDSGTTTPFGPGFVAAAVVLAAILTCGLILLVADNPTPATTTATCNGPDPTPCPTTSDPATHTTTCDDSGPATCATTPGATCGGADPAPCAATSDAANHATTCGGSGPGSCASSSTTFPRPTCAVPDGDSTVPVAAPAVDGWEVSRRVVVPRSAVGPGVVDPDGFRRCFQHSPTGAVFAAYNALAALADQTTVKTTVPKLFVPGPETDALLRESSSSTSDPTQLAGFRVLAATRDQVTVMLAVPVEAQYVSLTLTMVWYGGDWRVQPPPPGEAVGAPFAQVRSLADFVKWSGL